MVKNIKLKRGEEHLLDHVEAQEFRNHSSTKRKHQVVSQSMLSAIFDYGNYNIYSASLCSETMLERRLTNNYYQPTNPSQHCSGWYLKEKYRKDIITSDLDKSA